MPGGFQPAILKAELTFVGCNPHHQLAGHAVALAELLSAVGAHIATTDPGSDVEQVVSTVVHGRPRSLQPCTTAAGIR